MFSERTVEKADEKDSEEVLMIREMRSEAAGFARFPYFGSDVHRRERK